MQLKTFEAPTLDEALQRVRDTFGRDALIVSTDETRKGGPVRVTAARERHDDDTPPPPLAVANGKPVDDPVPMLRHGLADSGVGSDLATALLAAAHYVQTPVAPAVALAAAFEGTFRFRPLTAANGAGLAAAPRGRRLILVGPPGSGKTVTVAKLAARAQLSKTDIRTISIDTRKTGGAAHLEALAAHLKIGAEVAQTPAELAACADARRSDLLVIDTFGVNPFDSGEMADLASFIDAAAAEPVLVLPAGIETLDACDMTAAFAAIGCRRAIVTRIDLTRRLGSLLGAFHANRIDFCDVSVSPDILPPDHGGLRPLNPVALARLVLPDPRADGEMSPARPAAAAPQAEGKPKSASAPKAWILAS